MPSRIHSQKSTCTAGALVLIAIIISARGAAAQVTGPAASVLVRSYTHAQAAPTFAAARRMAGDILRAAGIEVSWMECGGGRRPISIPSACSMPPALNEVILRIIAAGPAPPPHRIVPLGFALVDVEQRAGSLATIYMDRVRRMAREARVSAADLLARAIAHEVGHLLLGTNQHAGRGLMRAVWTEADMRRNRVIDWLFLDDEARAIRSAVAARTALNSDSSLSDPAVNHVEGFRGRPAPRPMK